MKKAYPAHLYRIPTVSIETICNRRAPVTESEHRIPATQFRPFFQNFPTGNGVFSGGKITEPSAEIIDLEIIASLRFRIIYRIFQILTRRI
jgi:hypothetical protein